MTTRSTIRRRESSRRAFRIALFCAATLVGVAGFLGGALVYGLDHYAWNPTK